MVAGVRCMTFGSGIAWCGDKARLCATAALPFQGSSEPCHNTIISIIQFNNLVDLLILSIHMDRICMLFPKNAATCVCSENKIEGAVPNYGAVILLSIKVVQLFSRMLNNS